jgi:hypothetical protein
MAAPPARVSIVDRGVVAATTLPNRGTLIECALERDHEDVVMLCLEE